MTKKELLDYLTDGLDDEQAKYVKDALANEKIASRLTGLKQNKEYDALAAKEAELRAELEGGPEKPGAKAYREWYEKNYAAVQALQTERQALVDKYGTLDQPKGAAPVDPKPNASAAAGLTEADIARMVDSRIQTGYSPRWGHLLAGMGTVIQKHFYAGRKTPIDMSKFNELAEKYVRQDGQPDLDRAYDEYDKPEREAAAKIAQDKLVEQRVNDELMKRGAHSGYPAGADMTPGILSRDRDSSKFDKAAMERDLVNTFISGEEGGGKLTGFGVN